MADSAPVLADRYELHDRIGGGGMGEVWRATDRVLGRTVAVKVILQALIDEPNFLRRFHAEAKAMAMVHHPGVVAIHDFKGDDSGAYLVMEYVEGEPLSRLLARAGRLSPSAVMSVVRQAGIALALVHNRGIVHRDIKPANLLIRPDGTVVLADFGVAMGTGITNAGSLPRHPGLPRTRAGHRRHGVGPQRHLLPRRRRLRVPVRAAAVRRREPHRDRDHARPPGASPASGRHPAAGRRRRGPGHGP